MHENRLSAFHCRYRTVSSRDSLAHTGEAIRLDDIIFFLHVPVLIQGRVCEAVKPEARAKFGAQRRSSTNGVKLCTHVPLGYLRMSVAFLRNTWHRP